MEGCPKSATEPWIQNEDTFDYAIVFSNPYRDQERTITKAKAKAILENMFRKNEKSGDQDRDKFQDRFLMRLKELDVYNPDKIPYNEFTKLVLEDVINVM